jgi:hexosaminidase
MRKAVVGLKWKTVLAAATLALSLLATLVVSEPAKAGVPQRVSEAGASIPDGGLDVIPQPLQVESRGGAFTIRAGTRLVFARDPRVARVAGYFADLLQQTRGVRLEARPGAVGAGQAIELEIDAHATSPAHPESYTLEVSPDRIVLAAADPRGLFYAAVTLWQLCTANPEHAQATAAPAIRIPAMRIADSPRFPWRGLLLDSARHYQSPQFILRLLDWMALHKLNVLQWHLTDDQAWRLEIKKYPRLTAVGAWRVPAGAAHAADIDPLTGHPRLYGGFYSQQVVRQIVAHAADRNVSIVPEIDMPGHATAAIVAYPRLASIVPAPAAVPADWGVYSNLYNTEPATFEFLEDVLGEVVTLFPSVYVHVGGDEAVKDQWRSSPRIQARMRELGVSDEAALQSYFVARMGKFLSAHGRRLIGWDEILEGGLAPNAIVMSWRGIDGALVAAAAGHDSVLSPAPTLYLDNRQGNLPDEPPGRGKVVSLEDVYRFDPIPAALPPAQRGHILGVQANIWTEHIRTEERVQYMTFPRAAAVAEIGWSAAGKLSWLSFLARLPDQMSRYRSLGIRAADDAFAVAIDARLQAAPEQADARLSNQAKVGQIRYTLDGTDPGVASAQYINPLSLPTGGQIRAATFMGEAAVSPVASRFLQAAALEKRTSRELRTCTDKLVLSLEDDAPLDGERAVFVIDVMNPCWVYEKADLSKVTAIAAAVGQLPFNFQLGDAVKSIKLDPPETLYGELEVRLDGCDGERIAVLPLQPAVANNAVTPLPAASIAHRTGTHDLCLKFTRRSLDPMWALDWIQLVE